MADSATRIGVISPHSHNFCKQCKRMRVTANGQLMPCLGNTEAVDLRGLLRQHPGSVDALLQGIAQAARIKPEQHNFRLDAPVHIVRFMSMTGG